MTRAEARRLAESLPFDDLVKMMVNARTNIKDWKKPSRINKGCTVGYAFNLFMETLREDTHILAKINMIREFGTYLPNYEKPTKKTRTWPTNPVHRDPVELDQVMPDVPKPVMQYNVCNYCGAKDGRAGLLFNKPSLNILEACANCCDTLESGALVIHTNLQRTDDEIQHTMTLLPLL